MDETSSNSDTEINDDEDDDDIVLLWIKSKRTWSFYYFSGVFF